MSSVLDVGVNELSPGQPGGLRVAFAHGLEDGWRSWTGIAARLAPQWRTVALDLPWRAGNDYRWRRAARPAAWLDAGLTAVGEPVDVVVAHSYGANALLDICVGGHHPARVHVLLCPLYRIPSAPVTWSLLDRSRRSFETHIRDGVRARLGARAATIDPQVLKVMGDKALDRVGPIGLLTVLEQFIASADLPLAAISGPTLVLAGGADPTLPAAAARALSAAIPGARLHIDQDFDHFCHLRHSSVVAKRLRDFVLTAAPAAPHPIERRAS